MVAALANYNRMNRIAGGLGALLLNYAHHRKKAGCCQRLPPLLPVEWSIWSIGLHYRQAVCRMCVTRPVVRRQEPKANIRKEIFDGLRKVMVHSAAIK